MENSKEGRPAPELRVVIDDREVRSGLPEAVSALWTPTLIGRLPVADIEIGPRLLVERKTITDFAASLEDGRLFRQARAISRAALRPLMILEGEDGFDLLGLPPNALRGILLTLLVGYRIPILRTASISETAVNLAQLARQEQRRIERFGRTARGGRTAARTALDILGTIPGIGDEKARRLIAGLGSLKEVVTASEEDLRRVSGVGPQTARQVRATLDGPTLERRE